MKRQKDRRLKDELPRSVNQSTGSQKVGHDQSFPVGIDARHFFACGSSTTVRGEREGGAAAWLAGSLVVPSVQGQDCLHHRSYDPIRVFSLASYS